LALKNSTRQTIAPGDRALQALTIARSHLQLKWKDVSYTHCPVWQKNDFFEGGGGRNYMLLSNFFVLYS